MILLRQPVAQQGTQTRVGAFWVEGWRKGGGSGRPESREGAFAHPTAPPRTDPIQPLAQVTVTVVGFEPAPLRIGT